MSQIVRSQPCNHFDRLNLGVATPNIDGESANNPLFTTLRRGSLSLSDDKGDEFAIEDNLEYYFVVHRNAAWG